jgi:hypothetical protein
MMKSSYIADVPDCLGINRNISFNRGYFHNDEDSL